MPEIIKVLVADDEYYARKAMIKNLIKTGLPVEIMGDFENGSQVVAYLENQIENEIDLIMTDVRMPEMDGLMLAEWVAERAFPIEIMIISGYIEFEYAQKAIQFGVREYLIKPVEESDLRTAVERLIKKRQKEKQEMTRLVKRQMLTQAVTYLSFDELLKNQKLRQELLEPVFSIEHTFYWLMILQPKPEISPEDRGTLEQILNWKQAEESGYGIYLHNYDEYIAFMFQKKEESVEPRLYKRIKEIRQQLPQITVYISVSGIHQEVHSLKKAYQEAVYAMNQRLTKQERYLYFFQEEIKPENLLTKERELILVNALKGRNTEEAGSLINRILEEASNSYTLYVTVIGIFNLLYQIYSSGNGSEDSDEGYTLFSYRSDLYGFYSLHELKDYLRQMMQIVCKGYEEEPEHHYIISGVLNYIEKNYAYNISLNELAEHKYFVNVSYLSRLFKQEMGQPFSKYLIAFRLEKAVGMLESRILKINDIAALCGYNDVSRFIQYFKKQYGCTPEEYRGHNQI